MRLGTALGRFGSAACAALMLNLPVPAYAQSRLDRALQARLAQGETQPVRVIIRTKTGERAALREKLQRAGKKVEAEHRAIDGVTAIVDSADLTALASDPSVVGVSSDAMVKAFGRKTRTTTETSTTTDTSTTTETSTTTDSGGTNWKNSSLTDNHLRNTLGLDAKMWEGSGITVAVIDSGIEPTIDMGKVAAFYDFTGGQAPTLDQKSTPSDEYGHGTHVAGLISNDGDFSAGRYRGVAPKVTLVGLKVLDAMGAGYTSDVIRALEFATFHKDALGIRIVNLSLGHPILEPAASDPLVQAVEAATAAGLIVVASAGNDGKNRETGVVGYGGITSPGNAPSAITVGALRTFDTDTHGDDVVADFSSRGPTWFDAFAKPDLVAPGSGLFSSAAGSGSLYLENPNLLVESNVVKTDQDIVTEYIRLSGTSMAAAVTSGVVALMMEASLHEFRIRIDKRWHAPPDLTPNQVKAMLSYSAVPLAGVDMLTQGAGALNGVGAADLAASLDPKVAAGEWWLALPVTEVSSIVGESYVWGKRIVWGDRIMWGDHVYYNDPAWALRIVWGDRLVWGDRIMWGESFVWADRIVWGNRIVWGSALLGYDDGTAVLWGDRIIWSDTTDANRIIWGNLDAGLAGHTEVR